MREALRHQTTASTRTEGSPGEIYLVMKKPNFRRIAGAVLLIAPPMLCFLYEGPSWEIVKLVLLAIAFVFCWFVAICLLIP
jgi:4-hydroxybenzoate polyprenyltransferase